MYGFLQPQEDMARTTLHKIVSTVHAAVAVGLPCFRSDLPRFSARKKPRAGSPPNTFCTSSMLKLNRLGILPLRCQQIAFQRSFALSRFPDRGAPSGGRTRPRPPTPRTSSAGRDRLPLALDESTFDTPSSPLWKASQRPPSSDPEEGLKRLLQDDSLVVTRSVTLRRRPL